MAVRAAFPKDVVYDEDTIFWAAVLSFAKVATLADPILTYNVDAAKMVHRLVSAPLEAFQRFAGGMDGLAAYGIEAKALNWRKAFIAQRIARAFIRLQDYSSAHEFLKIAIGLDRRMRYSPRMLRYFAKVRAGKALSIGINRI
jgi:O-antigen biosynthesis protein